MLFHIPARVRVTGQGRLTAIASCMQSHVEWVPHGEKKGKEDADISSSRDFWTTRQLKDYLRKQGASSGEENLGWSRGKAKGLMPSTTYDRSISIVTRWRAKVFFSFFCHFLTKLFFYSYFFLRVMFIRKTKTQQHCWSIFWDERNIRSLPSLSGFA